MAEHNFIYYYNKLHMAEHQYILLERSDYSHYMTYYAPSFAESALENANAATGRYMHRAISITKSPKDAINTVLGITDANNKLYTQLESMLAAAWEQGGHAATQDAINKTNLSVGAKTNQAIKKVRSALGSKDDQASLKNKNLDIFSLSTFLDSLWSVLEVISSSENLKRAYEQVIAAWSSQKKIKYDSAIQLDQDELAWLNKIIDILEKIRIEYHTRLNAARAKGESTNPNTISVNLISYINSLLSNFMKNISETYAVEIVNNIINTCEEQEVVDVLTNLKIGDVKVTNTTGQSASRTGSLSLEGGGNIKQDVTSPFVSVAVAKGKDKYNYDIQIRANVKSYPSLSGMTAKNMNTKEYKNKKIKIQEKESIEKYINGLNSDTRFYVQNVLIHNWNSGFSAGGRLVRQGLAARFFEEWLSGSLGRISGGGDVDLANFVIINEHLFSMYDIVEAVAKSFRYTQSTKDDIVQIGSALTVTLTGGGKRPSDIKNEKIKEGNNYTYGFERSSTVVGQLKHLGMVANINPSVFFNVAVNKYGVRPIF